MPSAEQLAAMYPFPHDHRIYGRGHHERVEATIMLAEVTIPADDRRMVADLSCGNGVIARRICTSRPGGLHLGDFAGAEINSGEFGYLGAVEETITLLPLVDVFISSETIEHLDDPGAVLALARTKAERLLLSTPLECWGDTNGEHLWAWDREGVEDLCARAGWTETLTFTNVDSTAWGEPYNYGIWVLQ
jgi:hypothetical protein